MSSWLQHQHNAGKAQVEFFYSHTPAPCSWINYINIHRSPAFNYNKVIEFPVNNNRQYHMTKITFLQSKRTHTHPITTSSFNNTESRETITPYSTVLADL